MTDKTWWDKGDKALEPKRSFRWEIQYTTNDIVNDGFEKVLIPSHYITSVKMPSFSFQKEEVDQIGAKKIIINPHPTFTPVEVTFIDDEQNSIYGWIYWYFYNTGIKLDGTNITPSYGYYNYAGNYNFSRATNFFGSFKIFTLKSSKGFVESDPLPKPVFSKREILQQKTENYKNSYKYKSPTTKQDSEDDQKKAEQVLKQRNEKEQRTGNYRIDEIELVKPFITDFKQSDLSYNEGGFISYTIQITYASYKYISYSQERSDFNKKAKDKFGTPQVRSRAGQAPQSSGEPVLNNTDS